MKHFFRLLAVVMIALVALAGTSTPAQAFTTYYNNKLVYGVGGGGQRYWIASTASSYTSYADNAMANWINTSTRIGVWTPLYWTKTTTKSSARMEIHGVNFPSETYCGVASFYKSGAAVYPWLGPNRNWAWGKIDINTPLFNGSHCSNRQGIVSHEMGHVFGLNHMTGTSSPVMYQYIASTTVKWATVDDADGINWLY